jgi:hypothetical protein
LDLRELRRSLHDESGEMRVLRGRVRGAAVGLIRAVAKTCPCGKPYPGGGFWPGAGAVQVPYSFRDRAWQSAPGSTATPRTLVVAGNSRRAAGQLGASEATVRRPLHRTATEPLPAVRES